MRIYYIIPSILRKLHNSFGFRGRGKPANIADIFVVVGELVLVYCIIFINDQRNQKQ